MKSRNGEVKIAMKQDRNVLGIPSHVACSDITTSRKCNYIGGHLYIVFCSARAPPIVCKKILLWVELNVGLVT